MKQPISILPGVNVYEHNKNGFLSLLIFQNPFSNSLNIEYDLPEDARVELSVFDVVGRKITTLVDDQSQTKGGSYKLQFNDPTINNLLSPGTYFL